MHWNAFSGYVIIRFARILVVLNLIESMAEPRCSPPKTTNLVELIGQTAAKSRGVIASPPYCIITQLSATLPVFDISNISIYVSGPVELWPPTKYT